MNMGDISIHDKSGLASGDMALNLLMTPDSSSTENHWQSVRISAAGLVAQFPGNEIYVH